jgi:hypothetical protein
MRTRACGLLFGWALALVMLWSTPASAQNILLLQDNTPWGYSYWYTEIAGLGYTYTQQGSSVIPTVDLTQYDLVIVPSQQGTSFNSSMNTYMYRFEDFLDQAA